MMVEFPARVSHNLKCKMTGDCCFFNFPGGGVDGKGFQSESCVFKLLSRRVDKGWPKAFLTHRRF